MDTLASIIIPVRDQVPAWLRRCVLSAARQSVAVEVLVVTAADSPERVLGMCDRLASRLPNARILVRERTGFAAAINTGFARATGPRVGLLMSDDWLMGTAVERCLPHRATIVSTGRRIVAADGRTEIPELSRTPSQAAYDALPNREARASYLKHFMLFDLEAVRRIGGVDETIGLTGPDDYDMVWTLLDAGATARIVPEPLYVYRDHDRTRLTLRDRERQVADLRRILDKHGVPACEQPAIIARHARWYGRTMSDVQRDG